VSLRREAPAAAAAKPQRGKDEATDIRVLVNGRGGRESKDAARRAVAAPRMRAGAGCRGRHRR